MTLEQGNTQNQGHTRPRYGTEEEVSGQSAPERLEDVCGSVNWTRCKNAVR